MINTDQQAEQVKKQRKQAHKEELTQQALARHSTMLYSMQEGTLSSNGADGLMKHGQASREVT